MYNEDNGMNSYGNQEYVQPVINKPEVKPKDEKKKGSFIKRTACIVLSAVLFGTVAGGVMFGVNYTAEKFFDSGNTSQSVSGNGSDTEINTVGNLINNMVIPSSDTDNDITVSNNVMNVEAVAAATLPAMVQITGTTNVSSGFSYGNTQAACSGSGIIVGKNETELLVVTNAHVVDDVNNLKCVFIDNQSVSCTVKGAKSNRDIAVVSVSLSDIPESTKSAIAIAELEENATLKVGQSVVAIGNALGEGQSVTTGVISALDRSITVDNVTFTGLILTDAAINSGNSGGALLNSDGKVIAINFAKTSTTRAESMGYSIPVSNVSDIIDTFMNKQTREKVSEDKRAFLGITALDVTSSYAAYYGYPEGILITTVNDGSPASEAGLKANDIIVGFDDNKVTSMSSLQNTLQYYAAGEKVSIEYYRVENNKFVLNTTEVTLGKKS